MLPDWFIKLLSRIWYGTIGTRPEGYGQIVLVDINVQYGSTYRKVQKALRKGFSAIDHDRDRADACVETYMEDGYIDDDVWFRDENAHYPEWWMKKVVDGVAAYKFKKVVEKSNEYINVRITDHTADFNKKAGLYNALQGRKDAYTDAMNRQDFEGASEIKKQIDDLNEVIRGRKPYSWETVGDLVQMISIDEIGL